MVRNFANICYKEYWKEANKLNSDNSNHVRAISNINDEERDPNNICKLFSNMYKRIFATQNNFFELLLNFIGVSSNVESSNLSEYVRFFREDVKEAIDYLKSSIGMDGMHSNKLKTVQIYLKSSSQNCTIVFLRTTICQRNWLKGLYPTLKDRYGDVNSSSNYGPVIISFFKEIVKNTGLKKKLCHI